MSRAKGKPVSWGYPVPARVLHNGSVVQRRCHRRQKRTRLCLCEWGSISYGGCSGDGEEVKWHVVCSEFATDPKESDEIWTVSRDPKAEGWTTDCGQNGYGLTYADAKELADAANARNPTLMIASLRAIVDPSLKLGEMKLITPCDECGGTIYHRPHCSSFREMRVVSIK